MLNENQINLLPERITQRLSDINTEYLENIGAVLKEIGELRPKDVHQLQQMYKHGADVDKVIEKLSRESAKNVAEIYEIFDIVAKENYNYAEPFYKAKKKAFIPYEDNKELQGYVRSLAKQTVNEYINLTQHTAFAVFDKGGKNIAPLFAKNKDKVATSLSDTYTKIIDYAVTKVQLGGENYSSAMREVIKAMTNSGIKTVDYATGYTRRLDTAVRQNILWGVKECNQNTADRIGQEFGADGYEISYHSNPRPSHADMGGGQYAIGKARTINGVYYPSFSDVEDLLEDFGCLHFKFPILLGISSPAYSKAQLEEFKANDNKVFEFEGKKYTGYEATQMQRKLETAIRNERDLLKTAKAFGNNELINEAKTKISLLTSKYAQFSKASGLSTKMERTRLGIKNVDNSAKSGIIKENGRERITTITDAIVEKVPYLKIEGFTEEHNAFVQQQHKELLQYAKNNNDSKEVAFVFRKGLKDRTEYIGTDDSIDFGSALFGKGEELFVMHNHPRNSSFSNSDIVQLIAEDNIKYISVVKNNGNVEVISKTMIYDKRKVAIEWQRAINNYVSSGEDTEYDIAMDKLLTKLNKKGYIVWIK